MLSVIVLGLLVAQGVLPPPPSPTPAPQRGVVTDPCRTPLPLRLDWGQVCTFAAANAALPMATNHRVVFFGDSITELWIKGDPSLFENDVLDRGISGQTTSQMLVRFREDVLDLHPAVVQILGGTNDLAGNTGPTTLAQIQGNIATMAELAHAHGIKVILGSIPPAAHFSWRPHISPVEQIRAMNAWLRDYARRKGYTYADYYALLAEADGSFKPAITLDGVHPNPTGFQTMRPVADAAIKAAFAQR
jgi:lysophospholipase L1-like esterase